MVFANPKAEICYAAYYITALEKILIYSFYEILGSRSQILLL